MRLRGIAVRLALAFWLSIGVAGLASAGEDGSVNSEEESGFCSRPFTTKSAFRSKASMDLYNAALWMGGAAAAEFGTNEKTRWSSTNSFDNDIRSGFRGGSPSARNDADTASDVMLGMSIGLMPLVSIGKTLSERDCHQAYDMATDAIESITLTLFLTEATKVIAGRERPYVQECDGSPPRDARCGNPDRKQSFFSGHASLAAAGAGLTCSYAVKRKTWGESGTAQALPCVLGIGAALTTGALRLVADKHWGTDVLVGFAVGGTVGYFDTWGPFDLLRFEVESDDHAWDLRGVILPYAGDGQIGARLGFSF
jgi:hypothetical protein